MNILQVSIYDIGGGAEKIAWDLHNSYLNLGYNSTLVVGWKKTTANTVINLSKERYSVNWFINGIIRKFERYSGIQALGYYNFSEWWKKHKFHFDIVHLHNVHSSYFDIGILPKIAETHPLVQTIHDCWTFTGHCAYPFSCLKWKSGCGNCLDMASYPGISTDSTRFNWERRKRIYNKSKPVIVSPSQWLINLVSESHLKHLQIKLIHNGIDITRFNKGNKHALRTELGLPVNKAILLFVANGGLRNSSHQKDPATLLKCIEILAKETDCRDFMLLSIGGQAQELPIELRKYVMQLPYTTYGLENYYQIADVLVYPTKADNCPLVLIEAMASGLPIVSTDIGGCREMLCEYSKGYIVQPKDPRSMAAAIKTSVMSNNYDTIENHCQLADKFTATHMTKQYINLYKEIINRK